MTSFSILRGEGPCPRQHSALKSYYDFNLVNSMGSSSTKIYDIINVYSLVFDDLFFFGNLQGGVRLVNSARCAMSAGKLEEITQQRVKQKGLLGELLPARMPSMEIHVLIVLYDWGNYSKVNNLTRAETLKVYLGTLVHEMLHASFDLRACDHERCKQVWQKQELRHGVPWLDAAYAMEKATEDLDMLGLRLKLRTKLSESGEDFRQEKQS